MKRLVSILLSDFYKQCHPEQYDKELTRLVAYFTPRQSRFNCWDKMPVILIQKFIKKYLIEHFNEHFFNLSEGDVVNQYTYVIRETMGANRINYDKILRLHRLGYLPLDIRALDEGTFCPMGCPAIEISNTHKDFIWVVNAIETILQNELWYPMTLVNPYMDYRKLANEYYKLTCDNPEKARSAISEFGMRSLTGVEGSIMATEAFLCCFDKTATIPAIWDIHQYYGDPLSVIGKGMASTEHSVMCSSFALDGDEETLIRRLLMEIYPDGNFSMVCDSYDYWNVVDRILPGLKKEILSRNGTLYVRGDSGDPVDIVCETVRRLWMHFGGTTNNKGYKVLDSHVRAIYGDAITQRRAKEIYTILEKEKFSVENVALGIGGFSAQCLEEQYAPDGFFRSAATVHTFLYPYTRDSLGIAVKTTYGEAGQGNSLFIYKDPATDKDKLKKSQKGCCIVSKHEDGTIKYMDGYTLEQAHRAEHNLLTPVFRDGILLKETSFTKIRNQLWNNQF